MLQAWMDGGSVSRFCACMDGQYRILGILSQEYAMEYHLSLLHV